MDRFWAKFGAVSRLFQFRAAAIRQVFAFAGLFALFLALTVGLQAVNGAYSNEFGSYSDEPAHFVTGLMVHDYLRTGDWMSPVTFAEHFYVHYPKVAIGHWGLTFYVVQGVWEQVFGASRISVMLLMASTTSLLALSVYYLIPRWVPRFVALAFALCLPFTTVFQQTTASVMCDPLSSLLLFWAAICWGRFLDGGKAKYSVAFGALAALAILTRGDGLLLALLPPLSLLMSRRFDLLSNLRFWYPAGLVALICGPWYIATLSMQKNGMTHESFSAEFIGRALPYYSREAVSIVGIFMSILADIGLATWKGRSQSDPKPNGPFYALASLLLVGLAFHVLVPAGFEERYLSVLVAPILVLAAVGMERIARMVAKWEWKPTACMVTIASAASVIFLMFAVRPGSASVPANRGFTAILDDVERLAPFRKTGRLLIASDEIGEGMFVAAVAVRDTRPGRYALRASKCLATSRWDGKNYRPLFDSAEQVADWLAQSGIEVLVMDNQSVAETPEQQQLQEVLASHKDQWQRLGAYDLVRNGQVVRDCITVYRQTGLDSYAEKSLEINMSEMLGRTIR
jgi:4-amino-4-deoxy-L-arabinose transferase-like glycosyltransferase